MPSPEPLVVEHESTRAEEADLHAVHSPTKKHEERPAVRIGIPSRANQADETIVPAAQIDGLGREHDANAGAEAQNPRASAETSAAPCSGVTAPRSVRRRADLRDELELGGGGRCAKSGLRDHDGQQSRLGLAATPNVRATPPKRARLHRVLRRDFRHVAARLDLVNPLRPPLRRVPHAREKSANRAAQGVPTVVRLLLDSSNVATVRAAVPIFLVDLVREIQRGTPRLRQPDSCGCSGRSFPPSEIPTPDAGIDWPHPCRP
jgi:hypothetical protein